MRPLPIPDEIVKQIAYYLDMKWEWRIITKVINRSFHTDYRTVALRRAYAEQQAELSA